MFDKNDCSYNAYRKILGDVKDSGKYCDYADVLEEKRDNYLILRHDIEFSIERAFHLSEIETAEGICSSYFVQITNNAYNPFSQESRKMLSAMSENGHHIGLHYHRGKTVQTEGLAEDIIRQTGILAEMLETDIDRFSFHRPPSEYLKADLQIDNLINAYGHQFFTYLEKPDDSVEVKYIADYNHHWKYGLDNRDFFSRFNKIQLLIHPLSWSLEGADHLQNFKDIVREKHDAFVETIEHEWKIFEELRNKL